MSTRTLMITNTAAMISTTAWMTGKLRASMRGDEQVAEPVDDEHRLDDDRAADEGAEVDAGDGQQRERRRSQGVAEQHLPGRQALGPRHEDEVLLEGGDHVAAQQPGEHRDGAGRQGDDRDDDRLDVLDGVLAPRRVEQRQPAERRPRRTAPGRWRARSWGWRGRGTRSRWRPCRPTCSRGRRCRRRGGWRTAAPRPRPGS